MGKRQTKSVGQPTAPVAHDAETAPTHVETIKTKGLTPRWYVVDSPDGKPTLIKEDTKANVGMTVLANLGYKIRVPDKDELVDLLTTGVNAYDSYAARTAATA